MSANQEKRESEDKRVATLRDAIRKAFPVVTYTGRITRHDGGWLHDLTEHSAIHEDDLFVYQALRGKTWTEVSPGFLRDQPDGFVLLTDAALPVYLGAWLMCSLEDIPAENPVREDVVNSFSGSAHLLRALNSEQRAALRSLLAFFHDCERNSYLQQRCAEALTHLDKLEREFTGFSG